MLAFEKILNAAVLTMVVMSESVVLATFSADLIQGFSEYQLRDVLSYISPDVVVTETSSDTVLVERKLPDTDVLSLEKIQNRPNRMYCSHDSGVQLVCVGSPYDLQRISEMESNGELDTTAETYVLSSLLNINIDLIDLEVELEGRQKYLSSLYGGGLDGTYTHLTTKASPSYRNVWGDGLKVNGAISRSDGEEYEDIHGVGILELYPDSVIDSTVLQPNLFGLEAIHQVGPKKSDQLVENGYNTIRDVADTTVLDLRELSGFGPTNSVDILYSARAQSYDDIYARSKKYLPDESYDPVYIDIQTDGLMSTMIWLIGVYDSWSGSYMTFSSKDPSKPGKAISAFLSWVDAHCPNRPIVAYNGMEYHFPTIHHHATKYASEHVDMWDDAWHFDPLWWGPGRDNAFFPSRTNKLADVTEALGWEREYDFSGEVIGKRFEQWRRYQSAGLEPDWDKYEQHSKDVVFSVEVLYGELFESDIISSKSSSTAGSTSSNKANDVENTDISTTVASESTTDESETQQGSLEEF